MVSPSPLKIAVLAATAAGLGAVILKFFRGWVTQSGAKFEYGSTDHKLKSITDKVWATGIRNCCPPEYRHSAVGNRQQDYIMYTFTNDTEVGKSNIDLQLCIRKNIWACARTYTYRIT